MYKPSSLPWSIQHSLYYFLKMLKFFNFYLFQIKKYCEENSKYLGIFNFLKLNLKN